MCPKPAKECEKRIGEDGQHQRADAAKLVRKRPPDERHAPSDKKQREEEAAVEPDVAACRWDTRFREKLAKRGDEDECVDERVHAIERPAAPRGPEAAALIGGKADSCSRHCGRSGHEDFRKARHCTRRVRNGARISVEKIKIKRNIRRRTLRGRESTERLEVLFQSTRDMVLGGENHD